MSARESGTYLGIGSVFTESVTSKLKTMGTPYSSKLLTSKPDNWRRIVEMLGNSDIAAVVVKLTGNDYERIFQEKYRAVADELVAAFAALPHLLLIHEAVVGGASIETPENEYEEDDYIEWNDRIAREHFGVVPDETRRFVHMLLDRHGATVTTYKRNAEASVLAASFVEDVQSNLLFRLYIPAGQIYEDEIARMLEMFHGWLGAVKNRTVRQGGYRTPNGRVIEFFGEFPPGKSDWGSDFQEFSHFLELVGDRPAAEGMLVSLGVDSRHAEELVGRYARDARRVLLDTKHERARRLLTIQQQLESELSDEVAVHPDELEQLVQKLIPTESAIIRPTENAGSRKRIGTQIGGANSTVILNQQIIHRVEGVVAQNILGPVHLGVPVDKLLTLIQEFGGSQSKVLEVSARELADPGAPDANRLKARQAIKSFLTRNASRIEGAAFRMAWSWVESQLGT